MAIPVGSAGTSAVPASTAALGSRCQVAPLVVHNAVPMLPDPVDHEPISKGPTLSSANPSSDPAFGPPKVSMVWGCSVSPVSVPRHTVHRGLRCAPPVAVPTAATAAPSVAR